MSAEEHQLEEELDTKFREKRPSISSEPNKRKRANIFLTPKMASRFRKKVEKTRNRLTANFRVHGKE
jgi:hypothetical protein